MSLQPEEPGEIPAETVRVARAAFRKGSLAIRVRDELGFLFTDEEFVDLFPDIRSFANALGWTLSGGQLQMVAVARGLMAKPRLLLLDEPSLGLAPVIVQAVFRIISEIRRTTTVLLVEQNAQMALSVANRGYVMETGRIVAEGLPSSLLNTEEIKAAYLGGRAKIH